MLTWVGVLIFLSIKEINNYTVKETIMQVSRSKKWNSQQAVDEAGQPMFSKTGKPILVLSYSVLQDTFFQARKKAGYTDIERGKKRQYRRTPNSHPIQSTSRKETTGSLAGAKPHRRRNPLPTPKKVGIPEQI